MARDAAVIAALLAGAVGAARAIAAAARAAPAPVDPLSRPNNAVQALLGTRLVEIYFAGLARGTPASGQVTFLVPDLPAGDYNLKLSTGGFMGNLVAVAVTARR